MFQFSAHFNPSVIDIVLEIKHFVSLSRLVITIDISKVYSIYVICLLNSLRLGIPRRTDHKYNK